MSFLKFLSGSNLWSIICKSEFSKVLANFWLIILFGSGLGSCIQEKPRQWLISEPVLEAGPAGSFDEIAVKDPSLVYFDGLWHLFYTARSKEEYTTGYIAAGELKDLQTAPRHELEMVRGKSRYGCAPQVFYFEPQRRWYLLFQTRDANYQPAFTTTSNLADPESWSEAQTLLTKDAASKWIDFWVIADDKQVYLFYTQAHDSVMFRSTPLHQFPIGWGTAKLALSGVHEAVHVYKAKDHPRYDLIYELNHNGVRSFGLATASGLAGPWHKVSDQYATASQLQFTAGGDEWTQMVSHGEAIRTGYNQTLEYDADHARWLIQGIPDQELEKEYVDLPWKLGIIELMD